MTALPRSYEAAPAGLAADASSLDSLRNRAASDPRGAAREVARQFEALFMQEMLKSMRQATQASGLLDNEGTKLGTELLDQQLATQMSGLPGGLSGALLRQLERGLGVGLGTGAGALPGAAAGGRGAVAAPL
uniref:rod-binding protein n=1 Tax=uncultured Azohydromonas sp. TaxID=487342 RepID=UPI002609DD67